MEERETNLRKALDVERQCVSEVMHFLLYMHIKDDPCNLYESALLSCFIMFDEQLFLVDNI